jgi:hypothetical protein
MMMMIIIIIIIVVITATPRVRVGAAVMLNVVMAVLVLPVAAVLLLSVVAATAMVVVLVVMAVEMATTNLQGCVSGRISRRFPWPASGDRFSAIAAAVTQPGSSFDGRGATTMTMTMLLQRRARCCMRGSGGR